MANAAGGYPVLLDDFETNLVDVGQIGELPQSVPAGQQGVVQGEIIAHMLGERENAAINPSGATNPTALYNYAHIHGGFPAENAYRQDVGETLNVSTVTGLVAGQSIPAGITAIEPTTVTFTSSLNQNFWVVKATDQLQYGPVGP